MNDKEHLDNKNEDYKYMAFMPYLVIFIFIISIASIIIFSTKNNNIHYEKEAKYLDNYVKKVKDTYNKGELIFCTDFSIVNSGLYYSRNVRVKINNIEIFNKNNKNFEYIENSSVDLFYNNYFITTKNNKSKKYPLEHCFIYDTTKNYFSKNYFYYSSLNSYNSYNNTIIIEKENFKKDIK